MLTGPLVRFIHDVQPAKLTCEYVLYFIGSSLEDILMSFMQI